MKRTALFIISFFLLTGCSSAASSSSSGSVRMGCEWGESSCNTLAASSEPDSQIGQKADMSSYESYNADTRYVFVVSDVEHMLKRMQNGETFVTYFGFSACPWCRDAMPILNETAASFNQEVDYIDTRSDPAWESNLDLKDYDKLVEAIGDLFPTDDDGKAHLDVPFVVFFKDGKVAYSTSYPQYDAHERKINEEEAEEEKENYTKGFEALQ